MHPKFELRGFMRQLDSPCYKTGIHTDCFECVRVCEEIDYSVISCLIIKIADYYVGGRSPDWLGEPRKITVSFVYAFICCVCLLFSLRTVSSNMRLLKKGVPLFWDEFSQRSFDALKKALTSPPVLSPPDYSKDFLDRKSVV